MTAPGLPRPTSELARLVEDIERHGFCLIAEALPDDFLQRVRRRIQHQAKAERAGGFAYVNPGHVDNQWVNMLLNKGAVFEQLVTHSLASAVIAHALGPDFLLSCCDAQIKHPGSDFMPLHTDQWWMPSPQRPGAYPVRPAAMQRGQGTAVDGAPSAQPIAGIATVNVMWLISDFTVENGATVVVPGSHLSGRQPDPALPHPVETHPITGRAGTALVFDGRLWHAAGANRSARSRYGITCTYCGPQFRPLENYTLGLRPEVKARASSELLRLLGYRAWSTYGHTGDPALAVSVPGEQALGELGEDVR